MADMEFTDEQFKPSNISPIVQQDGDAVIRRPSDDLAAADYYNLSESVRPTVKPQLGRGPTQEGSGAAEVDKPVLDVKPNYPAGVGGFAMRPNTGEESVQGPETLEE